MTKETTLSQLLERFKKARDTFLNKIDGMEFYENNVPLLNEAIGRLVKLGWTEEG